MKTGFLFRWGSAWVGAHYSKHNRRWCVNPLPFVTFWVTLPGGKTPQEERSTVLRSSNAGPGPWPPPASVQRRLVDEYRRHLHGTEPLNVSGRAAFYEDARRQFEG